MLTHFKHQTKMKDKVVSKYETKRNAFFAFLDIGGDNRKSNYYQVQWLVCIFFQKNKIKFQIWEINLFVANIEMPVIYLLNINPCQHVLGGPTETNVYTYIIDHYNPSVWITNYFPIPLMLCVLILYMVGGICSLSRFRRTDFWRSFPWQFYLFSEFLPEICWENVAVRLTTYCLLAGIKL